MDWIIFSTILFSHILAVHPFISSLQQGKLPNTVDFAVVSVILYYDFGIIFELLGFANEQVDEFFSPFLYAQDNVLVQAYFLLLLAPWLFRLGSVFTNAGGNNLTLSNNVEKFRISSQSLFYILTIVIAVSCALLGYQNMVAGGESVWSGRAAIGETLGPLIILLSFPMHFLAFYIRTSDALTRKGMVFSVFLISASILSTITVGQRTNILLPILMVLLFRKKITFTKLATFFMVGLIVSSALLPIFKWQYASENHSIIELVAETIQTDLSRGPVLTSALERTQILGTRIFPYPMAGFVYILLFYVPRSIAPFKGWSTAQYFTSDVIGARVEATDWGFGVGAIEELLLNIGFLGCIFGLIGYGMCMGLLDRLSSRIPSLIVPTRLSATWLCGYDLAALTLTFGTMAIVGLFLHYLFGQKLNHIPKQFESYS